MKLFFSTLMTLTLLSFSCFARDMIVITHRSDLVMAKKVKELLISEVSLPAELIQIRYQEPACAPRKESIVHICIDANEEVHFIEFKHAIVQASLSVFWEEK